MSCQFHGPNKPTFFCNRGESETFGGNNILVKVQQKKGMHGKLWVGKCKEIFQNMGILPNPTFSSPRLGSKSHFRIKYDKWDSGS